MSLGNIRVRRPAAWLQPGKWHDDCGECDFQLHGRLCFLSGQNRRAEPHQRCVDGQLHCCGGKLQRQRRGSDVPARYHARKWRAVDVHRKLHGCGSWVLIPYCWLIFVCCKRDAVQRRWVILPRPAGRVRLCATEQQHHVCSALQRICGRVQLQRSCSHVSYWHHQRRVWRQRRRL